ncbi:hypothetical protein HU200_032529 [Digitaria exilis]|uniref:Large ribosomal subunit protein eL14 domain-containing protein n=1 Tax=Digitaria exilis TaxID=1010633 RepID=A0A835ERZ3_9POAL|nr:hypothetical protein HU200_032529 [Digitaria exilis]
MVLQPFKRFVEIGRVALVNYGKDYGRLVVIVDVVDQNRALVDAPDMVRCQMNFKRLSLTDIKIDIKRVPKKTTLIKAMEEADVKGKWEKSSWGKKLIVQKTRASLNDFDSNSPVRLDLPGSLPAEHPAPDVAGFDGLDGGGGACSAAVMNATFDLALHGVTRRRMFRTLGVCNDRGTVAVSYAGAVLAWGRVPKFCVAAQGEEHVRMVSLSATTWSFPSTCAAAWPPSGSRGRWS